MTVRDEVFPARAVRQPPNRSSIDPGQIRSGQPSRRHPRLFTSM